MKLRLLPIVVIATCAVEPGAAQPPAPAAQVAALDADHDGRISQREYIDGRRARFTQFDRNQDGRISVSDFPRAGRSASLAALVGRLLSTADLNNDGAVTRAELAIAGTPLFYRADSNADGFVDGAERARLQAALSAPR
ncbi:MAG TPA: EF-hand domain-containing protein [Allosphingosinicella sp.]|jgi:Ca2+-binding EF-hand superfamily protein